MELMNCSRAPAGKKQTPNWHHASDGMPLPVAVRVPRLPNPIPLPTLPIPEPSAPRAYQASTGLCIGQPERAPTDMRMELVNCALISQSKGPPGSDATAGVPTSQPAHPRTTPPGVLGLVLAPLVALQSRHKLW